MPDLPTEELVSRLSPEFIWELALSWTSPLEVGKKHGLNRDEVELVLRNHAVQDMIGRFQKQIKEEGISMKLRAQIMAENLLPELHKMAKNEDTDPKTRHWAIEKIFTLAGIKHIDNDVTSQPGSMGAWGVQIITQVVSESGRQDDHTDVGKLAEGAVTIDIGEPDEEHTDDLLTP